jgi:hypothetical protein
LTGLSGLDHVDLGDRRSGVTQAARLEASRSQWG